MSTLGHSTNLDTSFTGGWEAPSESLNFRKVEARKMRDSTSAKSFPGQILAPCPKALIDAPSDK